MNLRKLASVAFVAAVAITPAAHATGGSHATACTSATARDTSNDVGGPAATRFGVCQAGTGYIEVGVNGTQFYVVASSDDFGYIGLSSFDSNGTYTDCQQGGHDADEHGSGSNQGGCYGVDGVPGVNPVNLGILAGTVPLPVCGDGTGEWYDSSRDGCRADAGDINDTITELLPIVGCLEAALATVSDPTVCL